MTEETDTADGCCRRSSCEVVDKAGSVFEVMTLMTPADTGGMWLRWPSLGSGGLFSNAESAYCESE